MIINRLEHIRARRSDLRSHIDLTRSFDLWEESCVPSYCHTNWLAAYVSWQRLFQAVALAERNCSEAVRILDFGSSVGELGHLLKHRNLKYEFIEQDQHAAEYLCSRLPAAQRCTLENAPQQSYHWVMAIDSLEHNFNFAELLEKLVGKLTRGGVLVLSGPTENWFYRLGRKIAGFTGDYHAVNIFDIERAASRILERCDSSTISWGLPLFRLSVWRKPA